MTPNGYRQLSHDARCLQRASFAKMFPALESFGFPLLFFRFERMLASRRTRAGSVRGQLQAIAFLRQTRLPRTAASAAEPRRRRRRSSADVVKGVCFDQQVVDGIPTESHDCPLNFVLTPTRTFRRGGDAGGT